MPRHPRPPALQPRLPGKPLTNAETRILQVLLAGTVEPLPALRSQVPLTRVLKRTETEWGPWIDLWVSPQAQRVSPSHFELSDVHLEFEDYRGSGGAGLFIHAGVLTSLEILAQVPLDFRLRKIRYERILEPEDPQGEPQFVIVDRRAIDQVAADIQEARDRESAV